MTCCRCDDGLKDGSGAVLTKADQHGVEEGMIMDRVIYGFGAPLTTARPHHQHSGAACFAVCSRYGFGEPLTGTDVPTPSARIEHRGGPYSKAATQPVATISSAAQ